MSWILCIGSVVIGVVLGTEKVGTSLDYFFQSDFGEIFHYFVNWGKFTLFLSDKWKLCPEAGDNNSLTVTDFVIGSLTAWGTFARKLSGFYEEMLLYTGICIFWLCAREFAQRLSHISVKGSHSVENRKIVWSTVVNWYSALRELSFLIREAYGSILFHRMLLMIFDLPITFGYMDGLISQLRFAIMFAFDSIKFIFAADACKQVDT